MPLLIHLLPDMSLPEDGGYMQVSVINWVIFIFISQIKMKVYKKLSLNVTKYSFEAVANYILFSLVHRL